MNKQEIVTELQNTITTFQQLISSFDETELNTQPFEGSWTPGQVAQHIIMANSGFGTLLNGPVKDAERAPDAMLNNIKGIFLDFTAKYNAPEFILPEIKEYQKERLLQALEQIKTDISNTVSDLEQELDKICLAFEIPGLGQLTRLEAVYFVIYHTQRHAQQLKNIKNSYLVS
uniref:DinB family protein n=1 Tax=Pedobacter schmidteae TaxID=2201271 RepID=UPI000EABEA87|nr:DinB family protein [Pedobacter schmidteae]